MKANKFSLLFFGSDAFSVRVLNYLLKRELCPIQVVTKKNSLLDQFSAINHLNRYRWPLEIIYRNTNQDNFNIGLVASFGNLIDEKTVNRFKYGLFNIHPSHLPSYRGSTPVQTVIMDGVSETGCTIMRIPPIAKFDIGDIVLQERLVIKDREYALDLRDRLADVGAIMAERLILNYELCMRDIRPQIDEGKSYAKKIKPEQGLIKFQTESSNIIDRKMRAYTGFIDLFTFCLNGLKVRLENMRDPIEVESYDLSKLTLNSLRLKCMIENTVDLSAGTMFFHKTRHVLCIKCADERWQAFEYVTPEFKSKMSALDFYNGYMSRVDIKDMKTDI